MPTVASAHLCRRAMMSVLVAVALASSPMPAAAQEVSPSTGTWFDGLDAGTCLAGPFDSAGDLDFSVPATVVTCDQEHEFEVVAQLPLAGDAYPSADLGAQIAAGCGTAYAAFLGRPIEGTTLRPYDVWPDATDWAAGAHHALCIVDAGGPVAGTAAGEGLTAPGETLAVFRETDGQPDVWLVDAGTGEPLRNVTDDDLIELLGPPDWSPDGLRLAYSVQVGPDDVDILAAPVEGGRASVLLGGPTVDDGPAFSPDGSMLAYISKADSPEYEIYTRHLENGAVARLTDNEVRDASPQWSPDGSLIAFRRRGDAGSDLWVMGADGSDPRRLTDDAGDDFDPRWSPDGTSLLFTSDRSGNDDVWVMDADGGDQRPLTTHPADDEYPTWSRDGRFVAFHSSRHGGTTLWLMRADGSGASLLSGVAPIGYPMFAPVVID